MPANTTTLATITKSELRAFQPYTADCKRGGNRGLEQAYKLRDLAARLALEIGEEPVLEGESRAKKAGPVATLMQSFVLLSDRVRILRGRPLPVPLRGGKPAPVKRVKTLAAPTLASLSKTPSEGQL